MSVSRLPDFATSLTFCINARKSLIYVYKKQSENNIDTVRQSNIVKSSIDRKYRNEGVNCLIMNELPENWLPTYEAATSKAELEVIVIPNICQYDKDQQARLVKIIRNNDAKMPSHCRIFIGMIPWTTNGEESHIFMMRDWLKHRFWFACLAPNEQEILTTETVENLSYTDVHCSSVIRRYILDIMVHLRMHRFVDITKGGGIQTVALDNVITLAQLISMTKFQKKFITPEHVKMACLWYFPLHIDTLKNAAMDTTVLYGSIPQMIDDFLQKLYKLNEKEAKNTDNPLFLETLIVIDVLNKIVPPV